MAARYILASYKSRYTKCEVEALLEIYIEVDINFNRSGSFLESYWTYVGCWTSKARSLSQSLSDPPIMDSYKIIEEK